MNSPELIIRTLDRHLTRPTRLIVYGRAALALSFPDVDTFTHTADVDAILPSVEMQAIEQDNQFWEALEKCNSELEPHGLYITHLFADEQLILTPDWLKRIEALPVADLRHLQIYRPDFGDFILTKMMRIDPQDRADISFLLKKWGQQRILLTDYFQQAHVPAIPEIQAAFNANRLWIATHLSDGVEAASSPLNREDGVL